MQQMLKAACLSNSIIVGFGIFFNPGYAGGANCHWLYEYKKFIGNERTKSRILASNSAEREKHGWGIEKSVQISIMYLNVQKVPLRMGGGTGSDDTWQNI